MTAMIPLGHHGSGLTLGMTGRSAFKMICRPGLEMAHRVSTALPSSVLIFAEQLAVDRSVDHQQVDSTIFEMSTGL